MRVCQSWIILTRIIDVGRFNSLWAAPFPRQGDLQPKLGEIGGIGLSTGKLAGKCAYINLIVLLTVGVI